MPYIERDSRGVIISLKQIPDATHQDFLAPTDKEIVGFLTGSKEIEKSKETLTESDGEFTRAIEDLIHLLIEKNIILFTELPAPVQNKIASREKLRSHLSDKPLNFLDDSETL